MSAHHISFVIPTKNEENTIGSIIDEIKEICRSNSISLCEIIITDDSNDGTRKIAKKKNATVVIGGGRGLGAAMAKGLKHAIKSNPDIIISIDGDGQVDLKEIPFFIKELQEQNADLAIGSRFKKKYTSLVEYSYPLINRLGIHILSFILRRFTALNLSDSHGGIRAMKSHVARELELIGTHTYVQESIIDAREKGFSIIELPSKWLERKHGKSRVVASIPKYILHTLPILLIRSGKHVTILFFTASFFILLSIIHTPLLNLISKFLVPPPNRESAVLSLALFSSGTNLLLLGIVLDLIARTKRR